MDIVGDKPRQGEGNSDLDLFRRPNAPTAPSQIIKGRGGRAPDGWRSSSGWQAGELWMASSRREKVGAAFRVSLGLRLHGRTTTAESEEEEGEDLTRTSTATWRFLRVEEKVGTGFEGVGTRLGRWVRSTGTRGKRRTHGMRDVQSPG
jgi:hypothetical protein